MHPQRRGHVVRDFADRLALVARQFERQVFLEPRRQLPLEREADAGPRAFRQVTGTRLYQLLIEQLVERETTSPELGVLDVLGSMHQLQRSTQLDQVVTGTKRGGMWIGDEGEELVQVLLDEGADLPMREAFGRRIHRKHQSRIALARVVRFRQHDELARHELLAVVVAHRSRYQQQLPLLDLPLEKWAAGPGAFE